jgi:hypothetical protein
MESDRCPKCGAPVGAVAGRCPLCGADLNAPMVTGPQFQPAIVGMKEPRVQATRRRAQDQDHRKNLILAMVGIAGLLLIAGIGYAGYKMIAVTETPVASAPPPPASGPAPLTLEGVAVPDPARADPTDLLAAARKRVVEGNLDYRLVEIAVLKGRNGVVNFATPGAQIVYRFLYEQRDPRLDKKDLKRERADLTLREAAPVLERNKAAAADEPVQDPLCVWSAAWRAAVASGFNSDSVFEAHYAKRPKGDKPLWTIWALDKPESKVEIDGISCVIRTTK